ncbi:hypothetical protein EJ04DRAFT_522218 [Polyplosphaeria fusca]|uniref:Uncharacterized protein n=1 Tax=Polyplosphaeria fusca TaxID=682080 RepID=A0A9P4V474_9PLEO|nr:hypothetical protein EJ04DRAFT_522218 [Polyplosphaeria fusca]
MTPTYGVSPSRPKHMVYLGYDDIKELRLYIQTDGDTKGAHITNWYSINDYTNKLKIQESKPSPRHMVQELGWFYSPESFSSICNDLDNDLPLRPLARLGSATSVKSMGSGACANFG